MKSKLTGYNDFPVLQRMLKTKRVWLEDRTYLGRSDRDGKTVQIGRRGEEADIERYLTIVPPKNW